MFHKWCDLSHVINIFDCLAIYFYRNTQVHLTVQMLENDGLTKMCSPTAEDEKFMKIKITHNATCDPVLSVTFSSLRHMLYSVPQSNLCGLCYYSNLN